MIIYFYLIMKVDIVSQLCYKLFFELNFETAKTTSVIYSDKTVDWSHPEMHFGQFITKENYNQVQLPETDNILHTPKNYTNFTSNLSDDLLSDETEKLNSLIDDIFNLAQEIPD